MKLELYFAPKEPGADDSTTESSTAQLSNKTLHRFNMEQIRSHISTFHVCYVGQREIISASEAEIEAIQYIYKKTQPSSKITGREAQVFNGPILHAEDCRFLSSPSWMTSTARFISWSGSQIPLYGPNGQSVFRRRRRRRRRL